MTFPDPRKIACLCRMCAPVEAPTYAEAHRLDCEARAVLRLPLEARREYLADMNPARADALRDAITREWERRKEAA